MEEFDLEYESASFCAYCGKELNAEYKVEEPYSYSRTSGKPQYIWLKQCPDYNKMQYGIHSHDSLTRYEHHV